MWKCTIDFRNPYIRAVGEKKHQQRRKKVDYMSEKTIDEIYHSIGQYVVNNILRDDWEKATLFIDIVEKSVGLKGKLILVDGKMDTFDTPANFLLAIDILSLHKKSTENIINLWNKSEFVLYRTGKFEMNFIWDQDYQDRIDKL